MIAVQNGLTSVRVSWSSPTLPDNTIVTGHTLYYVGGNDNVVVNVNNTSSYLLTDLQREGNYTISIFATTEHFFSDTVVLTVLLGEYVTIFIYYAYDIYLYIVPVPGLPSVSVISVTATTISISWTLPSSSVVDSYEVMWWASNDDDSTTSADQSATSGKITSESFTIMGLKSSTDYIISVAVTNGAGNSSRIITAVTNEVEQSTRMCGII